MSKIIPPPRAVEKKQEGGVMAGFDPARYFSQIDLSWLHINQKLLLLSVYCLFRTLLFHGLESDWLEDECDDEVFRKETDLLF